MNGGWHTLGQRAPSAARPYSGIALPCWRARGPSPPCDAPDSCLRSLPERLGEGGRLALGDPQHVPAGRYGQAALTYYGLLPALKGRLLPADSVRTALAWVARGEAPLGLGYASDARVLPALEALAILPAEAHPPIIYPLGRLLDAPQQGDALAFEAFLRSPRARAAWEAAGFTLLASPPPS
jgi:molybdate transport system substrate-binding protein